MKWTMTDYNYAEIWVTRILESRYPFRIGNPLLSSIVKFGVLPDLAFALFCVMNAQYLPKDFVTTGIMALTWLNLGPYFIWYYDQRLLPQFFTKASEIVSDTNRLHRLARKYDRLFSHRYWIITIPWAVIVICAVLGLRLLGFIGVFYWVIVIGGVWISVLTSIGFWGVFTTMLAIREISQEHLSIDPFHPDKLGGLSCIGYYAIGTTLLFSTGSLFLPVIFEFVSQGQAGGIAASILLFAVSMFSGFTLLSFLYPTIKTNRAAQSARYKILEKLRQEYALLLRSIKEKDERTAEQSGAYAKLNQVRSEYMDYRKMKLYPFEVEILIKLIISVILPFIVLLVDKYLLR